jgi:hypothetical protein
MTKTVNTGTSGGDGNDTLTATNDSNTWIVEDENAGTLNATSFKASKIFAGGAGEDTLFISDDAHVAGSINGGGGNDTLVASNQDNTWVISGTNSGTLNSGFCRYRKPCRR